MASRRIRYRKAVTHHLKPITVSKALPTVAAMTMRMLLTSHLGLGHGRRTSSNTATQIGSSFARFQCREYERPEKRDEAEPEEHGNSLRLVTALTGVVRSIGDRICIYV